MSDEIIDPLGNKITMASVSNIACWPKQTEKLLVMIGEYIGWGGDTSLVFVSDESLIGDFNLEDNELEDLSSKLGFSVKHGDLVVEVVIKMVTPV
jgi:hypothetical protein